MSGDPQIWPPTPRSGSSIPLWSLFCCMERRPGDNTCLRRIPQIRWPDIISNQELCQWTRQQPAEEEILRRRWRWNGHTLRKPASSTTRHALFWNPQGKRKRGRPWNTWCRDLEADVNRTGHTWGQLEKLAPMPGEPLLVAYAQSESTVSK